MYYVKAKGILSSHNGINIYRGCTHGCIYCDSRSNCYQITGQFEDIEVKGNAIELLDLALSKKRKKIMISSGSMCDPYLHLEKDLRLTRQMLETILKYRHGISILTKSTLIYRDLDLYEKINQFSKAVVSMTITTYDDNLCKIVEPNVAVTSERFMVLEKFKDQNIPIGIWLTPVLPFINDYEDNILAIVNHAIKIGVKYIVTFGNFGLTLRDGSREYYYSALDKYFPGYQEKYLRVYGKSYELPIKNYKSLYNKFISLCEQNQIMHDTKQIFSYLKQINNN